MRFEDFARTHGLILNNVTPFKWMSTPTVDHPHKRNGRYKFMGDVGWVQNWATMEKPTMWRDSGNYASTPQFQKLRDQEDKKRKDLTERAAAKAGWIMHQTQLMHHPYLAKKGFAEEMMPVWNTPEGEGKLVVAMRREGRMVGCQLINNEGDKKFLYGQQTKGAAFTFDAKGIPIFCEGLATGLSIQAVMRANKMRYTIHVCFSAGNLKEVARSIPNGIVVADNDSSGVGEDIAQQTGKPYWISHTVGHDFNDDYLAHGMFKMALSLKKVLIQHR
jgi:putative DNA primase/helicase